MLLLYLIHQAIGIVDYKDERPKVLTPINAPGKLVANMGGTIRLQTRNMPVIESDNTVVRLSPLGDNKYLIKFAATNRFMCGKPKDSGVVGCVNVEDGRSTWIIDEINNQDARLLVGNKCLIYLNYDSRKETIGNYLNLAACKGGDADYRWKILDADLVSGNAENDKEVDKSIAESVEDNLNEEKSAIGSIDSAVDSPILINTSDTVHDNMALNTVPVNTLGDAIPINDIGKVNTAISDNLTDITATNPLADTVDDHATINQLVDAVDSSSSVDVIEVEKNGPDIAVVGQDKANVKQPYYPPHVHPKHHHHPPEQPPPVQPPPVHHHHPPELPPVQPPPVHHHH